MTPEDFARIEAMIMAAHDRLPRWKWPVAVPWVPHDDPRRTKLEEIAYRYLRMPDESIRYELTDDNHANCLEWGGSGRVYGKVPLT